MAEISIEPVVPISEEAKRLVLAKLNGKTLQSFRLTCMANQQPIKSGEACGFALEKIAEGVLNSGLARVSELTAPYAVAMTNKGVKGDGKELGSLAVDAIVASSINNVNTQNATKTYSSKTKDGQQSFTFTPTKASSYDAAFMQVVEQYMATGDYHTKASSMGFFPAKDYREPCYSPAQPTHAEYFACTNAAANHAIQLIEKYREKSRAAR